MNTFSFAKTLCVVSLIGALLGSLSACQKPAGPAERAGQEIDQAAGQVGQQIEKAGEAIQDSAKGGRK